MQALLSSCNTMIILPMMLPHTPLYAPLSNHIGQRAADPPCTGGQPIQPADNAEGEDWGHREPHCAGSGSAAQWADRLWLGAHHGDAQRRLCLHDSIHLWAEPVLEHHAEPAGTSLFPFSRLHFRELHVRHMCRPIVAWCRAGIRESESLKHCW